MKILLLSTFVGLLCIVSPAQSVPLTSQAPVPQIVEVRGGSLKLKAYFWKPTGRGPFPVVVFNHGSGGEDAQHTAGHTMAEAAAVLAPVFLKHGYAFFYLCRRGQGLSADQGSFMQDLLHQEEAARGKDARAQLHYKLATTDHLDDALAGLAVAKDMPGIDLKGVVMAGHSFGGVLALLSGEKDPVIRAEVTFGAANSWKTAPELRERILSAVRKTSAPIMLIQATNDYDTTPGTAIAAELEQLHAPHLLKIYPALGRSSDDGHNLVYLAIAEWEPDVFQFLDSRVKR